MSFKKLSQVVASSALAVASFQAVAGANHAGVSGAYTHAPIGVMGDHMHAKGEFMFSYRAMRMEMEGMRAGDERVSEREVTGTMGSPGPYMISPTKMTMDMHMLGAMYAPSNDVTLMLMLPYIEMEMDHVTRMGAEFTTETSGIGDAKIAALFKMGEYTSGEVLNRVHFTAGLSAPTGSLDEKDLTPMGVSQLPYPMQLGTGTWDLRPAITHQAYKGQWNWGSQLSASLPLESRNDEGYRWGPKGELSVWGAFAMSDALSLSLRLRASKWAGISGERDDLNPMMVSTADTSNSGGTRVEAGLGANYMIQGGSLAGNRFSLEVLAPIQQRLEGVQLETDLTVTAGWQLAM